MRDLHVQAGDTWLAVSPRAQVCKLCEFCKDSHCHRRAPIVGGWPETEPFEWCGEFSLNRFLVREVYATPDFLDGITTCEPPNVLYPEELE